MNRSSLPLRATVRRRLFAIVAIAAVGVPLPVTLLLIVTGSLVAQGLMNVWSAIAIAAVGSVAGDQIGYRELAAGVEEAGRVAERMIGSPERIRELDAKAKSWGGAGVFFSRWLVAPLGPGSTSPAASRITPGFDSRCGTSSVSRLALGLFIWLGRVFSDRVQEIGAILGDLTWAILGLLAAAFLGWKLFFRRRTG